jgi:hypothetical protein
MTRKYRPVAAGPVKQKRPLAKCAWGRLGELGRQALPERQQGLRRRPNAVEQHDELLRPR